MATSVLVAIGAVPWLAVEVGPRFPRCRDPGSRVLIGLDTFAMAGAVRTLCI
jgi:hypothetical protein